MSNAVAEVLSEMKDYVKKEISTGKYNTEGMPEYAIIETMQKALFSLEEKLRAEWQGKIDDKIKGLEEKIELEEEGHCSINKQNEPVPCEKCADETTWCGVAISVDCYNDQIKALSELRKEL